VIEPNESDRHSCLAKDTVAGRDEAKFDQDYVIYDLGIRKGVCQTTSKTGLATGRSGHHLDRFCQAGMICSKALENTEWDIAVFDEEAHHLTARKENDGTLSKTDRYNVGGRFTEH